MQVLHKLCSSNKHYGFTYNKCIICSHLVDQRDVRKRTHLQTTLTSFLQVLAHRRASYDWL